MTPAPLSNDIHLDIAGIISCSCKIVKCQFPRKKEPEPTLRLFTLSYFWKLTPTTVTLTQATLNPLVFSTALNTASCTALATSVTT